MALKISVIPTVRIMKLTHIDTLCWQDILGDDNVKYQYLTIESIAMISSIGLAYFVVIIIAMHKLRPDYHPRSRYISEYAVGEYGQLAASSLVFYGLAILGINLCLHTILPDRAQSNIGLTLIAIWGVSVVITGFFDTDLKAEKMSLHGTVHVIASNTGVAASALGLTFLSFSFTLNDSTQSIAFITQTIAVVAIILAVLLLLGLLGDMALKYHHKVHGLLLSLLKLTGLTERLLLGISVVWLTIIVHLITK